MLTHTQMAERAAALLEAGRLNEAEAIYRSLLSLYPGNPDLLDALGVVSYRAGRKEEALGWADAAVAAAPEVARAYHNRGIYLAGLGRAEEAVASLERAIALDPANAEAWYYLGMAWQARRRPEAAIACYQAALRLRPDHADTLFNLGNALLDLEQDGQAAAAYEAAITLAPTHAVAHYNLGNVRRKIGDAQAAMEAYRAALRCDPGYANAYLNLGLTFLEQGRSDEAIATYRAGLERDPAHLGLTCNLGNALKEQGDIAGAIENFRRAVALDPGHAGTHSNLLLSWYYHPECNAALLGEEHRRWCRQHAEPLRGEIGPHRNERSPDRVLRIGYVSPDLREHVVGRSLLPVFEEHDLRQVEIVCYSGNPKGDALTARFRARSARWHETSGWSDQRLAAQVRDDGIDILVDLALHTAGSRLGVFARKPAPVQVAWLGYPDSTGLNTMDYAITDHYLDPPGLNVGYYAEEPMRLPGCWCCYQPPMAAPPPGELPRLRAGVVTFGSLNNFCKINRRTLDLWAQILCAVPGSRLLLLAMEGSHRERRVAHLAGRGVAAERVEFLGFDPVPASSERGGECRQAGYLRRYQRIDIALDPFPYNGMVTTCDALWMGVPVITLAGELPVSRAGLSLLTNAGLPEFAAATNDEYVLRAVELARDPARLAALRGRLRAQMQASPLLDGKRLAANLEAAWRTMWRRWCAGLPRGTAAPGG